MAFANFPKKIVAPWRKMGPCFFCQKQLWQLSKSHLKSSGFTGRVAMEVISSNSLVAFSKFRAANKTLAPCFARLKAVSNPIPRPMRWSKNVEKKSNKSYGRNSLTLGLQHGMAQSQESRLVNGVSKLVHRNYALCFYPGELCSFYLEGNLTFRWFFFVTLTALT